MRRKNVDLEVTRLRDTLHENSQTDGNRGALEGADRENVGGVGRKAKEKNVRNDAVDKRQARRFARRISPRELIAFHEDGKSILRDRWSIPDPIQFFS